MTHEFEQALLRSGCVSVADEHSINVVQHFKEQLHVVPDKIFVFGMWRNPNLLLYSTFENTWKTIAADIDEEFFPRFIKEFPDCLFCNVIDHSEMKFLTHFHLGPQTNGYKRRKNILKKCAKEISTLDWPGMPMWTSTMCLTSTSLFVFTEGECRVMTLTSGLWSKLSGPPTPRCNASACTLFDNLIMVVGGRENTSTCVELLDVRSKSWKKLAPMHKGGSSLCLIVAIPFVYAIGTWVERYCIASDTWEKVTEVPPQKGFRLYALNVVDRHDKYLF